MFRKKHTRLVFFLNKQIPQFSFFSPAGWSGAPDRGVAALLTHSNANVGWREGGGAEPPLRLPDRRPWLLSGESGAAVLRCWDVAGRGPSSPTREAPSCPHALSDLLGFCLQSSLQEMGPALQGFAPVWNETEIKETLRGQEMALPGNRKVSGSPWLKEALLRERD